jgi:hypothetical protein
MRIFIIHPGSLGDVLLAVPAMRALRGRFPKHELGLIAGSEVAHLLQACGEIDKGFSIEGSFLSDLLAGEVSADERISDFLADCELAICWLDRREAILIEGLQLLGVRRVILCSPFASHLRSKHQSERFSEILGSDIPSDAYTALLRLPNNMSCDQPDALRAADVVRGRGIIALHPGSGSRHKCCPPPLFIAFCNELQRMDYLPLLISGPADKQCTAEVLAGCHYAPHVLKNLDLRSLAVVLASVDLYVGHDSGVTHLAGIMGRPTLALFGPTRVERWGPIGSNVLTIVGESCRCPDWAAVQVCPDKVCLHISLEQLVHTFENMICRSQPCMMQGTRHTSTDALFPPVNLC